jgi:hypothetical protein
MPQKTFAILLLDGKSVVGWNWSTLNGSAPSTRPLIMLITYIS